ncbi:hypothetical protein ABID19_004397 [Mesorhizobium robiniae]|uniref:LysM domain-containing protein n=1 Tax=Mesorhizobium robiniae TaxID=559315 RepID=A0ABV2GST5_9HYPH
MVEIVDAAGRVTYRAGRYYGSPDDLAKLGLTNPTPPVPPPQPQPPLEPKTPPLLLQNGPLAPQPAFSSLLQQPGLSEGIFNDLAAGKSTEQVAQERGMTREAVVSTLAGGNHPVVTQPTSDNGDVRTTVIQDAQGRTVTEYYDFQHGTYYTTVQKNPQRAPVSNPVRDESGWKVEQTHDFQTGTNTTTRVDDLGTGDTQTETSLANGTRVETTVAEDGTSHALVTGPDGKKVELAPWQAAPGRPDVASPLVRPPELQDFIGPVASDKMLAVGGDQTIPSIQKELAEGRSIDEIAATRGISSDQVVAGMRAAGLTVTDTRTSVGHVVEVAEPQGGQTTTYTHDYDHGSTNVTVTKPNGNSTSDSVDGNGVRTHTETNAGTGAQTTHEVDPRSNTTTDITIDGDGRRTEIVKTKGANGSEETTTTVTFNGYQLTTAPDGNKTLTNTSNGDQQTIKAGSVQDSFATMLMEATPNSADPEIARQGQAQKAFAESQLAQARLPDLEQQAKDATQARVDAEGKYGTGRPAQPTLNPQGQVIDPIGEPPAGSPGELIGTQPPPGIAQPGATQTPIATNGGTANKWVPININGAWTWVHPEVARAAAAEAAANSRVIETNSLITASESDLQVYAETPEFNGAMRDLRSQVNEALAPHNLQWKPSTAPGTLADAQQAQTLAHDAYSQASDARGHYDQAVTSLDQAINQQAAMPFYPDGTTPVATAAGSNYDYDAEVAKGKQARADINKLFSDVDLQTKAGDKAITDFNVSMTGAIDAPPGTLAKGAQPVEIEIGGQKLQVAPEVAEAYNNSGDITALSNGDKPIRVQVDVARPDGTTGTEWRWVAPDLALQSIGAAQQFRLSEAYNNYFGALQTDADLGVELQDFQSRAVADYRQRVPYQFDPEGYQNGNGEYTGKLLDSQVVVKDGKLMLRNRYENDVFSGEDGHVLEVALAVNPNDTNYTDEMRGRPLNQEWMELAGPSSDGNACVASPLSAAKGGVESAALELNQLIHSGVTENLAAIDKQLPGLRTDYNQLVQTHGTGTVAPPEGTLASGETPVSIQVGGQTIKVAPDVAAQVQTQGPAALTESDKPVYVDIEIPSDEGTTSQLRGWVDPELALAGVRLTDAETQRSELTQTKGMLDNSIAYNQMRLRNPELLTDTTGTTEAGYLEHDEQGTLDGIYQARYQNLLNAGFNNEFEALDNTELSQTIDRTAGIDPSTEDGRDARQKIIDEIHETGGENAEVRVVPIFYSEQGSASHQTALYAVRTGDGTRYIDAAGQKFDSLEDFQDNNRQFSEDGKLIVPKNLEMTAGEDGRISLDVVQARNVSTWDKVVDPVVGIVGGVATVLSFTPLAPVAAPIAIGSGVYLGTRTAFKQADYLSHGGEWGDRESLMNMGMIAATALPVGGSALRSIGMVRAGIPASRALPGSIGALPMRSGSVTLAGREFTYNASPYATQVANYTRTAGGLNMAAHGMDLTAMAVGAPLVVQSGVDLAMHGGDMSGLELANSVLGLGTGVMGTAAGVRTIAGYRPGHGTANPSEATGQHTPMLEPDAVILPGENGGPEQVVVMGTSRSTPDLIPIAGRGNPDVIRVRAEDGQMVDAVVLGDQPASADAIFVPRHGEVPRPQDMAGKTHVLLRDPATGAPLILPWRGGGNSIPLGLVESRPMLPAGHQPKEIGPAPPTTHTLEQVRGMRQPDKWQAGEIYVQELNGSAGQEHFPVPLDPNGPFPVTRPGGRHVDAPVHTVRGTEAIEVKTYNLWTTISGTPQMREVPLTRDIQEQINKDVALSNSVPGYEPRWVFLDAPPSVELVQALNDARIIGNIYRHWTPADAAGPSAQAAATDRASHTGPREPRVTQAAVDGQSGPRLFIADGEGNVSRAIFAVDGNGEITPVASDPIVVPEGSTSQHQYTSGKDRTPFPATYLETGPDGSVSLRQDGYEPQSAYLDKTPDGKPLSPEQIQTRYQRESEYYSPLEMAERYGPNGPQPPRRSLREILPDFRVGVQIRVRLNTGDYLGIGSPTIGSVGFGVGTKTDFGAIGWSIVDSISQRSLTPLKDALGSQGVVSVRAREYRNITGLQAGLWPVSNQTAFPVRASDLFKIVKDGIFTDSSGYDIRPSFATVVGKTPDESGAATVIEMEYSPSLKGEEVTLDPHQRDFFGVPADNKAGHVRIEDTLPFDRVMTEFKAGLRLPVLASHVDAIDALPRFGFEKRPESPVKDTLKSGDVVSREAYDQIQAALGSTNLKVQFAVKDPQVAAQLVEALNRGDGVATIRALVESGQIDPSTAISYVENPIESGMRLSAVPGKTPYDYITLPTGEVRRISNPDAMLVDVIFNDSNRLPGFLSFNPDKFVTSKGYEIKGKANEWRNSHLPEGLHSKGPPQSRSMQTDGNIYENLYGQYGTPATRYTVSFSPGTLPLGLYGISVEGRAQYKANARSEPRSIAKDRYTTMELQGADGETYGLYAPQWLGRAAASQDGTAFMIPKGAKASLKRFLDDLGEHARPDQKEMIENFRNGAGSKIVDGTFLRRDDAAGVQAFLAGYAERKGNLNLFPLGDHEPIRLGSLVQPEVQAPPARTVRSWSADEIGNLSRAELLAVEPRHIAQLTSEQLGGLTPGQMAFLSHDQIAALRPTQLRALSADQLNGIRPSRVAAIPPGRIAGMNADQIAAFSPLQLRQFTSAQRQKITPDQLAKLDPQQLNALGLETGTAATAKSDIRSAMVNRLPLGVTIGAGMFLLAGDTLDGESSELAGPDGLNPGAPDNPPATNVPDPNDGVVKPDDTPPEKPDTKPDRTEQQFAVTSEIGLSLRESPDAHTDRLGVVWPDALVHETGPRKADAGGALWAPVRAFDSQGNELQGWVRADYLVAHPEGAQDMSGRFNPELEEQGYQAIVVQNKDSMIGLAINHQKSISATVALNLEHIADPSLLFAGDRVYLPR